MNCLLTGSTGYLGNYITNAISEKYKVVSLSRNSDQYSISLDQEVPIFTEKFELVIHAAGKAHTIPKTSNEARAFFDVNVNGTHNLLRGLEESRSIPKAFIFISTVAVYGRESGVNVREDSFLLASDPYGLSKIQAENLVIGWCHRYNVVCTVLRLPLLVGVNPPGNLGAMIRAINWRYYFNIAGCNVQKSMVLASDVAGCLFKVSEIGGIYNLTDGYNPTIRELSRTISSQLGGRSVPNVPFIIAVSFAKIGDFIGDNFPINSNKLRKMMATLTFDDSKARVSFGWSPTPVLTGFQIE
jgi:nucleoside-diphosphate-sugar epimerase